MKLLSILLLLSAGGCVGQQPCSDCKLPSWVPESKVTAVIVPDPQPAPLKCGKYEHVVHELAHCENTCSPDSWICNSSCKAIPERSYCAPDLHTVTEREWQELLERLKALDKYARESICRNLDYTGSITTDGGKTTINCADMAGSKEGKNNVPLSNDINKCGIKGDGSDCVKW